VYELLSMLVPLETLSGWPAAPDPSTLEVLVLLVGFPLLVFIVVIAIAKIGTAAHAGRGDVIDASDPLWVGGEQQTGVLEAPSPNPGTEASGEGSSADAERPFARDAEQAPAGDGESDDTGEHVGGAGARW
jgi:hypothetical protein